jgi:hypothetical protein
MPEELATTAPDPLHFNLYSSMTMEQEVNIYIPKNTRKGRYTLEYVVDGMDNPIYNSKQEFTIVVK